LLFPKAVPVRLRALWFAAFIVSAVWFLYWIFYDVLVWNKALTQAGTANYVGFIVSIVLLILGTQLGKIGVHKKLMISPEQDLYQTVNQNQQVLEWEKMQPVEQVQQIQPPKEAQEIQPPKEVETKQVPQGALVPRGCKFYLGYLCTRPESTDIPEECLACEHVVGCLSPTAGTTNAHETV
jgi:hypothetical protein